MPISKRRKNDTESVSEAPSYSDESDSEGESEESAGESECSFAFLVEHGYEHNHKMVRNILENEEFFDLSDCENISIDRGTVVDLARYAKWLEKKLQESQARALAAEKAKTKTATAPKAQAAPVKQKGSKLHMKVEVDKLAKEASSGISKQMSWRPTCNTGTSKWAYDGSCADPLVFGALLGLDGAPTFQLKRIPVVEFEEYLGGPVTKSVKNGVLGITGKHVNVRWNPDTGEFKFSGTYGK